MIPNLRVMLAEDAEYGQIKYPKVVMPKLNGIRAIGNGELMSRTLKPIPNNHTRSLLAGACQLPYPPDGELVVGAFDASDVYTTTFSGVMSEDGEPDVAWHVFDIYHPTKTFLQRLMLRDQMLTELAHPLIVLVPYCLVYSDDELRGVEAIWGELAGYEGLILKDPEAKYKQGRSTSVDQVMLRLVPWKTSEAVITGVEERQINNNESVADALGYLKKSKHKENFIGAGTAGKFKMKDLKTGKALSVAVPTVALQDEVWANPDVWVGRIAKYKFKMPVKPGGAPRHPQYEGLRDLIDM